MPSLVLGSSDAFNTISSNYNVLYIIYIIFIWSHLRFGFFHLPSLRCLFLTNNIVNGKKKVWFYIAMYPVRWTAQSALHFPSLADLLIPTPFSASLGSILAMQQLRNDYSLTFPPLSIARYSFIQLSRQRRREVKENAQTSKR